MIYVDGYTATTGALNVDCARPRDARDIGGKS